MAARKCKNLGSAQFFKVCQALIEEKAWFLENRPIKKLAAEKLAQMVGFPISEHTIGKLQEATGITWKGKINHPMKGKRLGVVKILAQSIIDIMTDLGKEVPEDLRNLVNPKPKEEAPSNGQPGISRVPFAAVNKPANVR